MATVTTTTSATWNNVILYSDGNNSFYTDSVGVVTIYTACVAAPPTAPSPAVNRNGFELTFDGTDFGTATVGMSNHNSVQIAPAGFYNDGQIVRYWSGKSQKLGSRNYTYRVGVYAKLRYNRGYQSVCYSNNYGDYYLDQPNLMIATEIYKDINLIIPAESGYYSDSTIYRFWDKSLGTFTGQTRPCT
jgi:hypothetical protein